MEISSIARISSGSLMATLITFGFFSWNWNGIRLCLRRTASSVSFVISSGIRILERSTDWSFSWLHRAFMICFSSVNPKSIRTSPRRCPFFSVFWTFSACVSWSCVIVPASTSKSPNRFLRPNPIGLSILFCYSILPGKLYLYLSFTIPLIDNFCNFFKQLSY